jgi:hypothetical protein
MTSLRYQDVDQNKFDLVGGAALLDAVKRSE